MTVYRSGQRATTMTNSPRRFGRIAAARRAIAGLVAVAFVLAELPQAFATSLQPSRASELAPRVEAMAVPIRADNGPLVLEPMLKNDTNLSPRRQKGRSIAALDRDDGVLGFVQHEPSPLPLLGVPVLAEAPIAAAAAPRPYDAQGPP